MGDGELCGSVFLNEEFERHISILTGQQYRAIKPRSKQKMMKEFDHGPKRTFSMEYSEKLSVDLIGVEDDPVNDIIDNTIFIDQ